MTVLADALTPQGSQRFDASQVVRWVADGGANQSIGAQSAAGSRTSGGLAVARVFGSIASFL